MAKYELGYDNIFLFNEWAGSSSNGLTGTAGGETLAYDVTAGTITITSKDRPHVYTRFGTTWAYYNIQVRPNTAYSLTLSMEGTSTQSQVYYVPLGTNLELLNKTQAGLAYEYIAVTANRGAGDVTATFTTPDNCAYVQLFFDVHDVNKSMTFRDIRLCRSSCYVSEQMMSTVRKVAETETGGVAEYGDLAEPTRDGYEFGGWFTGEDGTGTRVTARGRVQGRNMSVFAKWETPFRFGRSGCSDIKLRPFRPICSRPDIGGSSAMSLNIPVPSFAPIIPPQECVCFEFAKGEKEVDVSAVKDCATPKAKLGISIDPSQDCCTGKYTITPTLNIEVPCVPFGMADANTLDGSIKVNNRSGDAGAAGGHGVDGGVKKLTLRRKENCCDVQPVIEITLPDCVKDYPAANIPEQQISYCTRGSDGKTTTKHWKLIELVPDPEHCGVYPKVNPLELPCCNLPDWEQKIEQSLSNRGGKITIEMKRVNCVPQLSVTTVPIEIPQPIINIPAFCLETSSSGENGVSVTYKDASGTSHTRQNAGTITLTEADGQNGCKKYKPSMTLDLGTISGTSFGNMGQVFLDSGSGDLYIDGTVSSGSTMWYGGGVGNKETNTHADMYLRRGPLMRNSENDSDKIGNVYIKTLKIPYTESLNQQKLTNKDGDLNTPGWLSSRARDAREGEDGDTYLMSDRDLTAAETAGGGNQTHKFGNLSMLLPSGFQWHRRGVAGVLSSFIWETSGVLSQMDETTTAVLLSPAPSVWSNSATLSAALRGEPSSGLAIDYGENATREPGLMVNYGYGLRIYGRTYAGEADTSVTTNSRDRFGELEINAHDKDFMFEKASNPKLILNDKKAATESTPWKSTYYTSIGGALEPWSRVETSGKRSGDYTMPVVMADFLGAVGGNNSTWSVNNSIGNYRMNDLGPLLSNKKSTVIDPAVNEILGYAFNDAYAIQNIVEAIWEVLTKIISHMARLRVMNVHVGNAGIITGVDNDFTGSGVTRRAGSDAVGPNAT